MTSIEDLYKRLEEAKNVFSSRSSSRRVKIKAAQYLEEGYQDEFYYTLSASERKKLERRLSFNLLDVSDKASDFLEKNGVGTAWDLYLATIRS